ncbi:MAG TPA: SUF system NifU family Fe-S cluster assembly protein [Kineosporiaceae bacterium]|nr:SUF system NifU family Fe-S cluster assembly protein [Kineosporiaceae bacterium]
MASLDQLYQQVILDHDRERHGYGLRELPAPARSADSKQYNPLCGDTVTLRVVVEEPAKGSPDAAPLVRDVSWTGDGCSISQASTSVLHDLLTGLPVPEAEGVLNAFREMIRSRGQLEPDEDVLGDGVAFAGVGRHANRVKCAMLGWTAFEDALHRLGVSTPVREEK